MFHDVNPLNILPDSSNEPCVFLIWPITVIHVIDEESPFYKSVKIRFHSNPYFTYSSL